jgi:hypothetical protein
VAALPNTLALELPLEHPVHVSSQSLNKHLASHTTDALDLLGWRQWNPLVHQRSVLLAWVQGFPLSGYCPYILGYILRTSAFFKHLGIGQNKTVNSFVGRFQEIRTLKISEAPTFPPATGFSCPNLYSVNFMKVRTPTVRVLHFVFHLWCTDHFEPLVTGASSSLR